MYIFINHWWINVNVKTYEEGKQIIDDLRLE